MITFQIVVIAIASIAAQWVAWRLHVPAIIFLLGTGFVLGPIAGIVQPEALMGDLLQPAISAAVAIILFDGSLQLRFKELRETGRAVRHVIFLGAPIGWALISLAAHYVAGLEWAVAITLGGMLVVTGPTVILPMLRQARLNVRVGSVLKWEGIVNDPLGVIFAILAYEYFVASRDGGADAIFFIGHGFVLFSVCGVSFLLAHIVKRLFDYGYMPEYLKAPFLLCLVLTLFFGCNAGLHESGLIAVTILGLTLANIHTASIESVKRFKETITLLLVSGVFILLTANLDAQALFSLNWRGLLFIALLLFVLRPLTLLICAIGTHMNWREILLAGLIAPRGVVCAAMAGVIGPLLSEAGFADGSKILPIAFAVVVISISLHSLMIKPLARRLRLTTDETNGVIVAGAYPWSVQLAETLMARGALVMMVDNDWATLGRARLANIPVYYGELLSEETEFALEFSKYDTLIAATPNPAYNALLCEKFSHEYGAERVFHVAPDDSDMAKHRQIASSMHGRPLASRDMTLMALITRYDKGWRFRTTRIGKPEGETRLIVPEETKDCIHIGLINKGGVVVLYSPYATTRPAPKEDDFIILFEKPDSAE